MTSIYAVDLFNKTTCFNHVIYLEIITDLYTPAVLFRCKVKIDTFPSSFKSIRCTISNKEVFAGQVDLQNTHVDGSGTILTIEARSKGAELLDNQALPQTLWNCNIYTLFNRYITQHDFIFENHLPTNLTMPVFNIMAATSKWDLLYEFSNRLYGYVPYVMANRVILSKLNSSNPTLFFDNNNKNSKQFTSFTHEFKPYNLISRYYIRGEPGEYSTYANNPLAKKYGIHRDRYLTPPSELFNSPSPEITARFAQMNNSVEIYTLTTNQLLFVNLGQTVNVTLQGSSINLVIIGHTLKATEKGFATTLTLRKTNYKKSRG